MLYVMTLVVLRHCPWHVRTSNACEVYCSDLFSSRASAFYAKDGRQLGQWVEDIGLEMYRNLVEKNVPSGERLVVMTTKHESNDLMVSVGRPLSVCV